MVETPEVQGETSPPKAESTEAGEPGNDETSLHLAAPEGGEEERDTSIALPAGSATGEPPPGRDRSVPGGDAERDGTKTPGGDAERDGTKTASAPVVSDGEGEPAIAEAAGDPGADPTSRLPALGEQEPTGEVATSLVQETSGSLREPTIVLDLEEVDGAAATEIETAAQEPSADGPSRDDVFVILPEQIEGEIPVVDTCVVDAGGGGTLLFDSSSLIEEEGGKATEFVGGSETAEDVGMRDHLGDDGEPTVDVDEELEGQEAIEVLGDEDLDELASSLDEEDVLGAGDDFPAEPFDEQWGTTGAGSRRGPLWRFGLPAAAALLLGVTTYYFLFMAPGGPGSGNRVEAQTAGVESEPPATDSGVGATPLDPDASSAGDGTTEVAEVPAEPVPIEVPARRAFREGIHLALELGMTGEAGDE